MPTDNNEPKSSRPSFFSRVRDNVVEHGPKAAAGVATTVAGLALAKAGGVAIKALAERFGR